MGVVLGCNNYDVIDLGVMVPSDKILAVAKEEDVDIIGLSGLITPSLDEMVHVASEMQRLEIKVPLLIGGATTSKAHTAVKIEQNYKNESTIYVPDASRSVSVVSTLLNDSQKLNYCADVRKEYAIIRERSANRADKRNLLSYEEANTNYQALDWERFNPSKPSFIGTKVFEDYPLEKLIPYIDWTPFFITWQLAGKYPAILNDKTVGHAATDLFNDAQELLQQIVEDKLLTAKATIGVWPANRKGNNDVEVYSPNNHSEPVANLHFLRQQMFKDESLSNLSLADFIAPADSGKQDFIGGFVVSTGFGADTIAKKYEQENNDYQAILIKALADRLAEAFAEHMHKCVRTEFWGYEPTELLSNDELINEKYRGIRPAPGYPACPDHSEKETLFKLLDTENTIGVSLTESYAMFPAASVSGLYFSHPESRYFSVGKISSDQIKDLAKRKGVKLKLLTRLLSPNL